MIKPTPRTGRVARRTLLGLGLIGLVGVGSAPAAAAAQVTLGRFGFDVPATIRAQDPPPEGWQWQGQQVEGGAPSIIVLARADLSSAEPHEALGLLLATAAAGWLPGLSLGPTREGTTHDGSPALRQPIGYRPTPTIEYRGSLLITSSNRDATAMLAVLGTSRLTAGRIDQILDSARWSA